MDARASMRPKFEMRSGRTLTYQACRYLVKDFGHPYHNGYMCFGGDLIAGTHDRT